MPYTIPDFRKDGGPPHPVTVVNRDEADEVFGTRTASERTRHLRACNALGLLHTTPGRLTLNVRLPALTPKGHPRRGRAYVFRCAERDIPRFKPKRRRDRRAVYEW